MVSIFDKGARKVGPNKKICTGSVFEIRCSNYWETNPPSITNSVPVTYLDSSEARYRIP